MTLELLTQKYVGLPVDIEKTEETFTHMGKFGKVTVYSFSFDTENATVHTEVCVKGGKIVGFTPEKEPRQDEWGYGPEEEFTEEITPEECARVDLYLASILL